MLPPECITVNPMSRYRGDKEVDNPMKVLNIPGVAIATQWNNRLSHHFKTFGNQKVLDRELRSESEMCLTILVIATRQRQCRRVRTTRNACRGMKLPPSTSRSCIPNSLVRMRVRAGQSSMWVGMEPPSALEG